jgi:DNA-binding transcriptional ArsR family regulator
MDMNIALGALAALSHETRLSVFRMLVKAGPSGLSAGTISDALAARQNTMSSHLKQLNHAGLIDSRRDGRSVMYSANFDAARGLIIYLMQDCCAGNDAICQPIAETFSLNLDDQT